MKKTDLQEAIDVWLDDLHEMRTEEMVKQLRSIISQLDVSSDCMSDIADALEKYDGQEKMFDRMSANTQQMIHAYKLLIEAQDAIETIDTNGLSEMYNATFQSEEKMQ